MGNNMEKQDIVVRIVSPEDKPHPAQVKFEVVNFGEDKKVVRLLGLAGIGALMILFFLSLFNLGFSVKDVLVIILCPLVVGLIASYVIF